MKLTGWISCNKKPVRVGWYDTSNRPSEYIIRDFWDGKRWLDDVNGEAYSFPPPFKWRGIQK